jgi:hypothetical protein
MVVTLWASIRKVLSSYLGWNACEIEVSCGFIQSFQAKQSPFRHIIIIILLENRFLPVAVVLYVSGGHEENHEEWTG